MLPQGTPDTRRFAHSSGGGFCTVCGTVWPCAQSGQRDEDSTHP
jgi:hypothetical protein